MGSSLSSKLGSASSLAPNWGTGHRWHLVAGWSLPIGLVAHVFIFRLPYPTLPATEIKPDSKLELGPLQKTIYILAWLVESKGTPKSKTGKRGANSGEGVRALEDDVRFKRTLGWVSCCGQVSSVRPQAWLAAV